jgi:DNA-binding MarR family transcriptional regulator
MDAAPDRVDVIQAEWRRERPDLDPSPQAVIGRLHRLAYAVMERLTENYRVYDLTEGEFDLLAALRRAGAPYERAAGELADHTMITSGGLTKRVDRLAARGLVTRRSEASDARRRMIALTPAGRELIDRAITTHLDLEHALLADLGADDAAVLEGVLTRWLRILGED